LEIASMRRPKQRESLLNTATGMLRGEETSKITMCKQIGFVVLVVCCAFFVSKLIIALLEPTPIIYKEQNNAVKELEQFVTQNKEVKDRKNHVDYHIEVQSNEKITVTQLEITFKDIVILETEKGECIFTRFH